MIKYKIAEEYNEWILHSFFLLLFFIYRMQLAVESYILSARSGSRSPLNVLYVHHLKSIEQVKSEKKTPEDCVD